MFLGVMLVAFLLFCLVFFFFYRFRKSLPYYRVDKTYVRFLLQHAIAGDLPCADWYLFIGAHNLVSEELEQLRLSCCELDEHYAKASLVKEGKACMQFHAKGLAKLKLLMQRLGD